MQLNYFGGIQIHITLQIFIFLKIEQTWIFHLIILLSILLQGKLLSLHLESSQNNYPNSPFLLQPLILHMYRKPQLLFGSWLVAGGSPVLCVIRQTSAKSCWMISVISRQWLPFHLYFNPSAPHTYISAPRSLLFLYTHIDTISLHSLTHILVMLFSI